MQRRIEVCGGIASGKTTLARLFPEDAFLTIFENFQANPFWQSFYRDPNKYSFETEITFLLQHYHEVIAAQCDGKVIITDYSFVLDRAYVDVTLEGASKKVFLAVYDEVLDRLPPPTLLVHLVCYPGVELERIRRRERVVEQSITEGYLASVNQAVSKHVEAVSRSTKVLIIDSGSHDFAHDPQEEKWVLDKVTRELNFASCQS